MISRFFFRLKTVLANSSRCICHPYFLLHAFITSRQIWCSSDRTAVALTQLPIGLPLKSQEQTCVALLFLIRLTLPLSLLVKA
jgi:hypothetical protein